MKLRQRLALHYGVVVTVAILMLAGLSFHEFQTEDRLRAALPPERKAEADWGDTTESVVYSLIPIILIAGWWFTRRSLEPLTSFAKAVERVDIGSLKEPLERTGSGDEVDRLAAAFNAMAVRLDRSFQQTREFTMHASHELKTPLTVMRGEIETALREAGSCPPPQMERLHSLMDEVERLTKIVDALTTLSKADSGQVILDRRPVRLAEVVREAFEDAEILAEPYEVRVSLSECADVTVTGDRHRLRQLMLNLVDNAIKYNKPGGTVQISLRKVEPSAEIEIANTGDGIPTELQPRIFDRFVRSDDARRKAVEGCGLGLTIAQWVVHAHGGSIQLTSDSELTTARVRLPLAAA